MGRTNAFKQLGAKETKRKHPYCNQHEYDSDDFWECVIRHDARTVFHHSGTCKMGAADDLTAVVDPELR